MVARNRNSDREFSGIGDFEISEERVRWEGIYRLSADIEAVRDERSRRYEPEFVTLLGDLSLWDWLKFALHPRWEGGGQRSKPRSDEKYYFSESLTVSRIPPPFSSMEGK